MIKQASVALIMRVAGTGFWLLYTIAMARLLPTADFGTVMYVINFALILAPVATLGFESSTLKHASTYWSEQRFNAFSGILRQSRRMAIAGGLFFWALFMAATALNIPSPVTNHFTIAHLTGAAVLCAALMGIHRDTLRAADKLVSAFLGLSILRTLLPLLGSLALYQWGLLSITTALIVFCGALCIAIGIEFLILRKLKLPKPTLSTDDKVAHRTVAMGTWTGDMGHVVLMRAPIICLGFLTGPEILAIYVAVERIANLGQFLTDAVRTAAAPDLARACKNIDDQPAMGKGIVETSNLMIKSGVLDGLFLIGLAYPALWAMGDQFVAAYPLVFLFVIVQLGWTLPGPTAMTMNMTGLEKLRTVWTLLAAGILVLSIFLWVGPDTAWTAIAMQGAVVWSLNLWQVWQIRRDRGIWSGVFAGWNGDSS